MENSVHNDSIDTQNQQAKQITSFDVEDGDNQINNNYETKNGRQKSSFAVASINLFKSCIGSGVLATPYIFVLGGWLQGIIVVTLITLMIVFTTKLVVQSSTNHLKKQNLKLSQIVIILLGHKVLYMINSVLMLLQWGACASYFIFFINFFQYAFYRNDDISLIHQLIYLSIAFAIIFPLLFINDITFFSKFSLLSSIFIFTVLTGVIIYSINLLSQGQGQFSQQKDQLFSIENFFLQIGVSMFSIEGMGLIFTIKDSMQNQDKFSQLVNTVYIFVMIQNLTLGLVTSFAFGQNTEQIILLSLPYTWLSQFACIIYSIALLISLVLQLYPCFQMIEKSKIVLKFVFFQKIISTLYQLQKEKKGFIFRRTCTRITQVLFIASIVLMIPQFALLLSFIGGLSGAILQFLLPLAVYIKCSYQNDNLKIRLITLITCGIGAILGFGAAISSLKRAIQEDV